MENSELIQAEQELLPALFGTTPRAPVLMGMLGIEMDCTPKAIGALHAIELELQSGKPNVQRISALVAMVHSALEGRGIGLGRGSEWENLQEFVAKAREILDR